MTHLTLNSGHSVTVLDPVPYDTLESLRPMVEAMGGELPGNDDWTTVIGRSPGCASFEMRKHGRTAVFNVVAWTEEGAQEAWESLEAQYLIVGTLVARAGIDLAMPEMPDTLPWIATWLLPDADNFVTMHEVGWFGTFEFCLAHALIRWS